MLGYLIYHPEEVERNRRFIDFFLTAASRRGIGLELITTDQIACGIRGGKPFFLPQTPDFAVVRAMLPALSGHLEACGARVFNNAFLSEICNDKQKTQAYLTARGIPMLDTAFVSPACPRQPFPYPIVVKASAGCGGRQVFLCRDEAEYREKLSLIFPDSAVVQPLCDTPGRDVRAYVLGNTIIQAMLRYTDDDFRSNFGLHGSAKTHELTDGERALIERVIPLFDIGLVGIDLIYHGGQPYVNEVEDAVGTRMLYQYTDLDIVDLYMDLIVKKMA